MKKGGTSWCEIPPFGLSGRQDLNLRPLDPQQGAVGVPARRARVRTFAGERDARRRAERAGELVPVRSPDVAPHVLTTTRPLCNHATTVPRHTKGQLA